MDKVKRLTKRARAEAVFTILSQADPEPKTELNFVNHYTLLVAVALSAQSTDVSVNKATGPLFEKVTTPSQMIALGEDSLKSYIKTIGLYNNKAKNVIALSHALIDLHGGEVPQDLEALKKLPGVGSKTARVVLNCGFGVPYIAVDTHVFRVAHRIGLCREKTADKTQDALEKTIPSTYVMHAHHWLILHGRYVCKARKPLCDQCSVSSYCAFYKKTETSAT